jgi:hypothetical protein
MTQIINPDTGEYIQPEVAPVVPEAADPRSLPQQKGDPYAHIDVTDFRTAVDMNRGQLLTMANIAESRGDTSSAYAWRNELLALGQREDNQAAADRMGDILSRDKYVPEPGRILNVPVSTPWSEDQQWRDLERERQEAQAAAEATSPRDVNFAEVSGKAQTLAAKADDRKAELIESGKNAGTFTEADARVLAANESLIEKSAAVEKMMAKAAE